LVRSKPNFFWAVFWSFFILLVCFAPSKGIPKFSFFANWHIDKCIHFFLFFIQALLFLLIKDDKKRFYRENTFNYILFVVFYCLFLGLSVELIQHFFIETRAGDFIDFTADVLGAITALILFRNKKVVV